MHVVHMCVCPEAINNYILTCSILIHIMLVHIYTNNNNRFKAVYELMQCLVFNVNLLCIYVAIACHLADLTDQNSMLVESI